MTIEFLNYITKDSSGAHFSKCRKYRFTLWRKWTDVFDQKPVHLAEMVAFICLNPSTADERKNDATVTRCVNYSKAWGGRGFIMLNLFPFRATDPNDMKAESGGMFNSNMKIVSELAPLVKKVVCGWGNHGSFQDADYKMFDTLSGIGLQLNYLRLTGEGCPQHPLYLPKDLEPQPWLKNERKKIQASKLPAPVLEVPDM